MDALLPGLVQHAGLWHLDLFGSRAWANRLSGQDKRDQRGVFFPKSHRATRGIGPEGAERLLSRLSAMSLALLNLRGNRLLGG